MPFPTTRVDIIEELRKEFLSQLKENIDINQLQFVGALLHTLSVLEENEMYYTTFLFNELFLATALTREGILYGAQSLGYVFREAIPASGYVTLYLDVTELERFHTTLNFPQLSTPDNIIYTIPYNLEITYDRVRGILRVVGADVVGKQETFTTFTATISTPQGIRTALAAVLPVVQATINVHTFVLSSLDVEANKTVVLSVPLPEQSEFIGKVEVFVNGERYTRYGFLYEMSPNTKGYVLNLLGNQLYILLGNGVFGTQQLPGTSVVVYTYVTKGSRGNVLANTLSLTTPVIDNYSNQIVTTYTQHAAITNGVDGETPNEIRVNAIRSLRSQERLVTYSDFTDQLLQHFPSLFTSVYPLVKERSYHANTTFLAVVPTLFTISGTRPLKCCVGSWSAEVTTSELTEPKVLIQQGQTISLSVNGETVKYVAEGVCPFEITLYSKPLHCKVSYATTNFNATPQPLVNITSRYDFTTFATIGNFSCDYITSSDARYFELSVTLVTNAFAVTEDLEYDLSDPSQRHTLNDWQTTVLGLPAPVLDIACTITNAQKQTTQLLQPWYVARVVPSDAEVVLTLKTYIGVKTPVGDVDTVKLESVPYSLTFVASYCHICEGPNKVSETLFVGRLHNFYFKRPLDEGWIVLVDAEELPKTNKTRVTLYNVPIIEHQDWLRYHSTIHNSILQRLGEINEFVKARRMLTNRISLSFAKTWGFVSNIVYTQSTYTYTKECANKMPLPLRVSLKVIPRVGEDATSLVQDIQTAVWEWFEKRKGIQTNIYLSELHAHIVQTLGERICGLIIVEPICDIVYDYDVAQIPKEDAKNYSVEFVWLERENIQVRVVTDALHTCGTPCGTYTPGANPPCTEDTDQRG